MHEPRSNPDAADLQAPEALAAALRRLELRPLPVPAERDRQILASSHDELAARLSRTDRRSAGSAAILKPEAVPFEIERPTQTIPFPRPWIRWAAAAGIALIGAVILFHGRPVATDTITLEQPTILDALALARKVEAGGVFDPKLDLNADGHVDQSDARLLAQRAVALPEGGAL